MVAAWVSFGIQKHRRVNVSRHLHDCIRDIKKKYTFQIAYE